MTPDLPRFVGRDSDDWGCEVVNIGVVKQEEEEEIFVVPYLPAKDRSEVGHRRIDIIVRVVCKVGVVCVHVHVHVRSGDGGVLRLGRHAK